MTNPLDEYRRLICVVVFVSAIICAICIVYQYQHKPVETEIVIDVDTTETDNILVDIVEDDNESVYDDSFDVQELDEISADELESYEVEFRN